MGMPHSWVGKVETGERRLDVDEFVRLCRALDIDAGRGIAILEAALPPTANAPALKAAESRGQYTFRKTR